MTRRPGRSDILFFFKSIQHIIEQGHTDSADTTSLYVPSIELVVAGDVVYNQCHMYRRRYHARELEELGRRSSGWQR